MVASNIIDYEVDSKANPDNQIRDLLDTVLTGKETERIAYLADTTEELYCFEEIDLANGKLNLSAIRSDGHISLLENYPNGEIAQREWLIDGSTDNVFYYETLDGMQEPILFSANNEDIRRLGELVKLANKTQLIDLNNSYGNKVHPGNKSQLDLAA